MPHADLGADQLGEQLEHPRELERRILGRARRVVADGGRDLLAALAGRQRAALDEAEQVVVRGRRRGRFDVDQVAAVGRVRAGQVLEGRVAGRADRGHDRPGGVQGERLVDLADVNPGDLRAVLVVSCRPVDGPAQPAGLPRGARGVGRLPDVHRLEVLALRVRVADALDDAQEPVLIQPVECRQLGMKAQVLIDLVNLAGGQPQGRPGLGVEIIGVGDDGVQAVVAAGKLDDDEDRLAVVPPRRRGLRGAAQKCGGRRRQRQERRGAERPAEKVTASGGHDRSWLLGGTAYGVGHCGLRIPDSRFQMADD